MSEMSSRMISGARWTVLARLSRAVIGVGTMAVLSRFLTPAEFGIVALIIFMMMLASFLSDFGLRVALIHGRREDEPARSSVFWANMVIGLSFSAAVFFLAEQIADLFDAPNLAGPLRLACPAFAIGALQGVSMSVLEQRFDFRRIATAEITASALGAMTAIVLVLLGLRIGAVVAQQLVYSTVGCGLIILQARWWPRAGFSWSVFAPLVSYGGYVAMGSLSNFFANNLDRPVLSRVLSAQALGYFSVAGQIVASPLLIIGQAVARVLFPILSAMQDDRARLAAAYLKVEYVMVAIMAPVSLGIIAVSAPFVDVVLGSGWGPVVPLVMMMAIQAGHTPTIMVNTSLFAAMGKARFQFHWAVGSAILTIGALFIGAQYGLRIAVGARVAAFVLLTWGHTAIAIRLVGVGKARFLDAIGRPILAAAIMFAAVWGLLQVVDWPAWAKLLGGVPLGIAVYGTVLLAIDRKRAVPLLQEGLKRNPGGFVRSSAA